MIIMCSEVNVSEAAATCCRVKMFGVTGRREGDHTGGSRCKPTALRQRGSVGGGKTESWQ